MGTPRGCPFSYPPGQGDSSPSDQPTYSTSYIPSVRQRPVPIVHSYDAFRTYDTVLQHINTQNLRTNRKNRKSSYDGQANPISLLRRSSDVTPHRTLKISHRNRRDAPCGCPQKGNGDGKKSLYRSFALRRERHPRRSLQIPHPNSQLRTNTARSYLLPPFCSISNSVQYRRAFIKINSADKASSFSKYPKHSSMARPNTSYKYR